VRPGRLAGCGCVEGEASCYHSGKASALQCRATVALWTAKETRRHDHTQVLIMQAKRNKRGCVVFWLRIHLIAEMVIDGVGDESMPCAIL
jgi:hypothetical protein